MVLIAVSCLLHNRSASWNISMNFIVKLIFVKEYDDMSQIRMSDLGFIVF